MLVGLRNGRATKGSQRHLQDFVNDHPQQLNNLILSESASLRAFAAGDPAWKSPLAPDGYREYKDGAFLTAVGMSHLTQSLSEFWPSGGPVWDALATVHGRSKEPGIILVEAKSHIPELVSGGSKACPESRAEIIRSLSLVKRALGVPDDANWMGKHYQYANRLAHLYFLKVQCGIQAWLVFVHFLRDQEQNGPYTVEEWETAMEDVRQELQLPNTHSLQDYIISVFPSVRTAASQD